MLPMNPNYELWISRDLDGFRIAYVWLVLANFPNNGQVRSFSARGTLVKKLSSVVLRPMTHVCHLDVEIQKLCFFINLSFYFVFCRGGQKTSGRSETFYAELTFWHFFCQQDNTNRRNKKYGIYRLCQTPKETVKTLQEHCQPCLSHVQQMFESLRQVQKEAWET